MHYFVPRDLVGEEPSGSRYGGGTETGPKNAARRGIVWEVVPKRYRGNTEVGRQNAAKLRILWEVVLKRYWGGTEAGSQNVAKRGILREAERPPCLASKNSKMKTGGSRSKGQGQELKQY